jgi:prophage antirepressor-like protein
MMDEYKKKLFQTGIHEINVLDVDKVKPMYFIDEPNFYNCIFTNKRRKSYDFMEWVSERIIPCLRSATICDDVISEDSPR